MRKKKKRMESKNFLLLHPLPKRGAQRGEKPELEGEERGGKE